MGRELAGLAIAFAILVRLMPCNPGMYWWKDVRAVVTDCLYWFIVRKGAHNCNTFPILDRHFVREQA